ncbi:AAA family ATPase [Puniceicoccaceae bacterium K14]|nr:AAA family ATPase [Puniceicoccaceae bacterium K14]
MYQSFYGLKEMPFNITPDPNFLYLSPTHQEALQHIKYGVAEKKGFIVLTGEVGCGKTTLCRHFIDEIDEEKYETALILNPRITETQLLTTILAELGEPSEGANKNNLVQQVNDALLKRIQQGKDILLIIDEAQNLTFELLEQLRLLSNLETDKQKLLQIILLGQPEFKKILAEKRLRQLRQRILVHSELRRLNRYQVEQYIHHRIAMAGGQGIPFFTSWAVRLVHRKSKGTPRVINNICDKALLASYIRNSEVVQRKDIRTALKDIDTLNFG